MMDIIISANKNILTMMRNAPNKISSEISKEEYMRWVDNISEDEKNEDEK